MAGNGVDMNKYTTKQISYESNIDLALKIVQSAPLGYTGFDAHKPIEKGFISITYATGIGGSYLSLQKLAVELNIANSEDKQALPPKPYFPGQKTWDAVMRGKKGFVLLR
jgi:hypothetical protein